MHLSSLVETPGYNDFIVAYGNRNREHFNPDIHTSAPDGFQLRAVLVAPYQYEGRTLYDDMGAILDFDPDVYPGFHRYGWLTLFNVLEFHPLQAGFIADALVEGFALTNTFFINRTERAHLPQEPSVRYSARTMRKQFFKALTGMTKGSNYVASVMKVRPHQSRG
jgi:hypothetical protein